MASQNLYERAVEISQDYLGPAGERFMRRQIQTHLGKEPEELRAKDMPELINWIKLTFALLTDDTQMIDTLSERLMLLTKGGRRGTKKYSVQ